MINNMDFGMKYLVKEHDALYFYNINARRTSWQMPHDVIGCDSFAGIFDFILDEREWWRSTFHDDLGRRAESRSTGQVRKRTRRWKKCRDLR